MSPDIFQISEELEKLKIGLLQNCGIPKSLQIGLEMFDKNDDDDNDDDDNDNFLMEELNSFLGSLKDLSLAHVL